MELEVRILYHVVLVEVLLRIPYCNLGAGSTCTRYQVLVSLKNKGAAIENSARGSDTNAVTYEEKPARSHSLRSKIEQNFTVVSRTQILCGNNTTHAHRFGLFCH